MSARVILITGANGGLGQAIARSFLDEAPSNIVWLGVHRHKDQAERLSSECAERCAWVELDVTQPASWQTAVARVLATQNRLDVLVNNAGKHSDSLLATMPQKDWDEVLATNLHGAFHG